MSTLSASRTAVTIDSDQLCTLRRRVQQRSAKVVGKGGQSVAIPPTVRSLLAEIARNMEAGKSVSVVAKNHEITA